MNQGPQATGRIPAHTIVVGGTSTQDVAGFLTDPEGDALTYAASSSAPAVATIALEGTVATITGVAEGNAVMTVTATDADDRSAAQAFGVTVEPEDGGVRPATVAIFGLRSVTDRNTSLDPTNLSGDISVLLDVQYNDETVVGIDLTVGDQVIQCRGASGDAAPTPGLAESGQLEVDCFFNTDAVDGECVGEQLMPAYPNGTYSLGASITTADGETRAALATQQITLNNSGYVMISHHAGKSLVHSGSNYYGGPTGEGNTNSFSACPVSYKGTTVGELALSSRHTDTESDPRMDVAEPVKLAFAGPDPEVDPATELTLEAPPFTWTVPSAANAGVENTADDEYWIVNSGDIKDDAGLLVSSEFRGEDGASADAGPFKFDFAPPSTAGAMIGIGKDPVAFVAGTSYSAGDNAIALVGPTDGGVGIDPTMTRVDVGDCAANPIGDDVDRTTVGFKATYEGVGHFSELAEDDAVRDDPPDDNGANCYVAELGSLVDLLGNAWSGGATPASWLQTANFGVDKTAPVIREIEFDNSKPFMAAPVVNFEIDNEDLASGDPGTAVAQENSTITIPDAEGKPVSIGKAAFNLAADDEATATISLSADGAYTATVTVQDAATPPNTASFSVDLVYDTTVPTFETPGLPATLMGGASVAVDVSGVLKDATAGVGDYTLTVRDNSNVTANSAFFCETADAQLDTLTRAPNFRFKGNGAASVGTNHTLTVTRPANHAMNSEDLCVLLDASDAAGNSKTFSVGTFKVDWSAQAALVLTDTEAELAEGQIHQMKVRLSQKPTADVTVAIASSDEDAGTVDLASVTFTPANFDLTQNVTLSAVEDDDTDDESVAVTFSASGGGYDGASATFTATVLDPDMKLTADVMEVTEGTTAEITLKVTRSESAAAKTGADTRTLTYTADSTAYSHPVPADSTVKVDALVFAEDATEATLTIEVTAIDDDDAEDEELVVTMQVSGGRALPDGGLKIKIVDDDGDD